MNNIKMWMQLLATAGALIWAALTDDASKDAITAPEWVVIATMFVGAFGVQIVPNLDAGIGYYAKGVVSFLTAALPVIGLGLAGGLTGSELLGAALAGLAALGLVVSVGNRDYVFATQARTPQAGGVPGV